ncbi:hypothetical protein ACK3SF_03925 [Candidatus Nanosalina sp. VS9-1]|uniref:hypothetical protein n=1 Tax=Candidatus Nanosalina sp. VS9-1 TaxID=3388566 RepID=UPI0039E1F70A
MDSDFTSEENSIFTSSVPASISVARSARISGLWQGVFDLTAEKIVLKSGARFRPEGGRIKIG